MLSINIDDVMNVLNTMIPQLIGIGVAVVVAIAAAIALRGKIRGLALMAALLAVVICVNLICVGPMSNMLDLISGGGTIEAATAQRAQELAVEIGEGGIVLLENDEALLPLSSGTKLNVFGWASINPILGGAGSGALNDAYPTVDILQSLSEAGIETNSELTQFYTDYKADRPVVGMWSQDWTLPEPNVANYDASLLENAENFSDTAMIVISRSGGEGADLPADMIAVVDGSYQDQTTYTAGTYDDSLNLGNDWDQGDHYLQLSNREEELVELVCAHFDNVIVVYNGANAFEMGFVNDYPQIKSVLWTGGQGHVGMTALGRILTGEVNPSGRMIDTYVYNMKDTPWWNNFGDFNYTNMEEFSFESFSRFAGTNTVEVPSFVNYVEGIYVGYRFYETAAATGFINYDEVVQYPFGYGLSYTTFAQDMGPLAVEDGRVTFDVTVENTGDVSGRDVVQVYANPPYTEGGIEKASANLVAFAKTGVLEPGQTETLTLSFSLEALTSYDYAGAGAYVLEGGNYTISINSDSHTVLDSDTLTVSRSVIYDGDNKRDSDLITALNRFDYANGGLTYLSRAGNFANYAEATAAPASFEMSPEAKADFYNKDNYLTAEATAADEDPSAPDVVTGNQQGIQLESLRGLPKDDPQWDAFMDQMTLDEMNTVISLGGYQTAAVESVGKIRTNDCDGPASINNNFTGVGSIGFPVGEVIAATWDKDIAYSFGESIGQMANEMNVSGWYAPAMNNHRTAFAGRNFEYYSEDPYISGAIAASAVQGSQDNGVYAYMKHFAMNDQEANRCDMLCTWSNEQAIREIYLKPFEMCVKDSNCLAVMSSFNYIGNRWAGGSSTLCKDVLRGEWGFEGFVETDYFGVYGYMNADQAIRNGSDLMLVNYPTETNDVRFRETNGAKQAMRDAAKNILYVVVNSRAYEPENMNTSMPIWRVILYAADAVIAVLVALWAFALFRKKKEN